MEGSDTMACRMDKYCASLLIGCVTKTSFNDDKRTAAT